MPPVVLLDDGVLGVKLDHCPAVQDRHQTHRIEPAARRTGIDTEDIENGRRKIDGGYGSRNHLAVRNLRVADQKRDPCRLVVQS